MELHEAIDLYFRGEKATGIGGAVIGAVLLAAAFAVYRMHAGGFGAALAIPLVLLGLAAVVGGSVLAGKTGPQVAALHASIDGEGLSAERARMERVNANWPRFKIAWTTLSLTALLLLWAVRRDWAQGLGLALLLVGCLGFFVDVFAERRAHVYTDVLRTASEHR